MPLSHFAPEGALRLAAESRARELEMEQRQEVLGAPIGVSTLTEAAKKVADLAASGCPAMVCVADVNSLMTAYGSAQHMEAFRSASIVTADGMPIVWMLRALGHSVAQRVSGTDLVHALCGSDDGRKLRHYFFGGAPSVPEKVAAALADAHGINVVGLESPPYREMSLGEVAEVRRRIRESGANIVWVGLGCPKQERWMLANYQHLDAALVGIGAAFDFIAGAKKRAPKWMQRGGLEWLHRLCSEPKRLWRRYLVTALSFIPLAVGELVRARLGFLAPTES